LTLLLVTVVLALLSHWKQTVMPLSMLSFMLLMLSEMLLEELVVAPQLGVLPLVAVLLVLFGLKRGINNPTMLDLWFVLMAITATTYHFNKKLNPQFLLFLLGNGRRYPKC
jgi:hypothetical protein